MRIVFLLLLLANATFLVFALIDGRASGETSQQVQPDKIKLLTPQQVAALGPDKAAALPDVCVEWGPFGDTERARALTDLEPLALGRLLTQRRVDAATTKPPSSVIVIRSPSTAVIARLRELAPAYPGGDVKLGACDK